MVKIIVLLFILSISSQSFSKDILVNESHYKTVYRNSLETRDILREIMVENSTIIDTHIFSAYVSNVLTWFSTRLVDASPAVMRDEDVCKVKSDLSAIENRYNQSLDNYQESEKIVVSSGLEAIRKTLGRLKVECGESSKSPTDIFEQYYRSESKDG